MPINTWPQQERPREKLLKKGAEYLSEAELLAILLRHGAAGKTALDLARELLQHHQGLQGLMQAPADALYQFKGMGPAKYSQLKAAIELSRRCYLEQLQDMPTLSDSKSVVPFLIAQVRHLDHEVFSALFLNHHNQLIRFEILSHGSINRTAIYPREIIKKTLALNASALILCHNHPSGSVQPSKADIKVTLFLKQALHTIEVGILDHIIVGVHNHFSMADTHTPPFNA